MDKLERNYTRFVFILLLFSLVLGVITAFSFIFHEHIKAYLPLQQLRPMHVSAALFWILSGASLNIFLHNQKDKTVPKNALSIRNVSIVLWQISIVVIFIHYTFKQFGGREYWEFPGWISLLLLLCWIGFCSYYFLFWKNEPNKRPQYIIMWGTGMLFFLITFIEQNLWQITWFRESFLQEVTIQWKANGSMVGAWNQMIYGTSLYLMVQISGKKEIAFDKKSIVFYFLGFTNLLFNWGHHIYNLPTNNWMRHVAYAISMTEWILLINIIQGFKKTLSETLRFKQLISYRFLIASEFWVFLNLILALFMSIPAINRYTHGTHITVAHAMGTTIGINSMILLGSFAYLLKIDDIQMKQKKIFHAGFLIIQISLAIFWLSLIAAGVFSAYDQTYLGIKTYASVIPSVVTSLYVFATAGLFMLIGFAIIIPYFFKGISKSK
ncbi:MAG: cbb3-type cytochrome c oxidase subunit I [Bacteroidetes bacterium]|nr:cbb3-type cytochrome c oxidase subunit I [Bacteroidota bacterium]